ncbi:Transcription repressor (Ovate family protein) [Psidium guajava]|nr:Transcription repressor (Ovate family protein) [Psidium guajava]
MKLFDSSPNVNNPGNFAMTHPFGEIQDICSLWPKCLLFYAAT